MNRTPTQIAAERALPIFVANGWEWGGLVGTEACIPSLGQIEAAYHLLLADIQCGYNFARTGRLFVERDEDLDLIRYGVDLLEVDTDGDVIE